MEYWSAGNGVGFALPPITTPLMNIKKDLHLIGIMIQVDKSK
jgi:hypothetical protein